MALNQDLGVLRGIVKLLYYVTEEVAQVLYALAELRAVRLCCIARKL